MTERFHFEVPPNTPNMRVDSFCAHMIPEMNRSKFKAGLQSVCINGRQAKCSARIQRGDRIEAVWNNPIPTALIPEPIPLSIVFENEQVIVINKRAGMVTHPGAGNWTGTLVQALSYYRLYQSPIHDEFAALLCESDQNNNFASCIRMGIVHRLDKDTSGLIITARNTSTQDFLQESFKRRRVNKYYVALLYGIPKTGTGVICTSIFRDPRSKTRFKASSDLSKGKYARSRYKVIRTYGAYALVLFKIDTGRTHQIRIHARFIGCPVAGDPLYGTQTIGKKVYGLMLHAYKLRIRLPHQSKTEAKAAFTAPLPHRFIQAIRDIKGASAPQPL